MTDELAMAAGVIPVVQAAGVVKLPRRYEKAALGDPRTQRHRKISFCSSRLSPGDSMPARLDDLMTAIMWVKQELILLRQHDILLKRQFFDIHNSICGLHTRRPHKSVHLAPSLSPSVSPSPSSPRLTGYQDLNTYIVTPRCTPANSPPEIRVQRSASPTDFGPRSPRHPGSLSDLALCAALVRPSTSAMVLSQRDAAADSDTDGDDTFDPDFYRPRTSSMRTSRDLAALARRRGSKELI